MTVAFTRGTLTILTRYVCRVAIPVIINLKRYTIKNKTMNLSITDDKFAKSLGLVLSKIFSPAWNLPVFLLIQTPLTLIFKL